MNKIKTLVCLTFFTAVLIASRLILNGIENFYKSYREDKADDKNAVTEKIDREYSETCKKASQKASGYKSSDVYALHPDLSPVARSLVDANTKNFSDQWAALKKWSSGNTTEYDSPEYSGEEIF